MRTVNRVIYLILALVVFGSLGLLSPVQALGPIPDEPSLFSNTTGNFNSGVGDGALVLNDADSNTADSSYNFNNSKFHGWWRNTMIGAMNGFNAGGPYSALQDQYIYIDTSFYPVRIFTTYGTDRFPRLQPDAFDSRPIQLPHVRGVPTTNSFFYKGPNQLVNGYTPPFQGPFDPTLALITSDTLKLI